MLNCQKRIIAGKISHQRNTMIKKIISTAIAPANVNAALLLLRVGLSFFMARHGYDKLQTLLAGGTIDFPDPLHVGATASLAMIVFAEFFCSILLAAGLFTRFALVPLITGMLVVLFVMHANDPLDDKEHAFLYVIPYFALLLTGPGAYSLDARLFQHHS